MTEGEGHYVPVTYFTQFFPLLIHRIVFGGRYNYYHYFSDGKNEAQRGKMTWAGSPIGRKGSWYESWLVPQKLTVRARARNKWQVGGPKVWRHPIYEIGSISACNWEDVWTGLIGTEVRPRSRAGSVSPPESSRG